MENQEFRRRASFEAVATSDRIPQDPHFGREGIGAARHFEAPRARLEAKESIQNTEIVENRQTSESGNDFSSFSEMHLSQ